MKYRKNLHSKDWYLRDPRVRKWIVQCIQCQNYGRHPEAPNVPKAKFEENFKVMYLNQDGLCDKCADLNKQNDS